jgi:quercetin dioxygenase-like cupin family protein
MAIAHLASGEVTNLSPLGNRLNNTPTKAFFKDEHLEVIRMILPAGKHVPTHAVEGPITVQCLEGEVRFRMGETEKTLRPADFIYLSADTPHELFALQDSSLLVTIVLPHSPHKSAGTGVYQAP